MTDSPSIPPAPRPAPPLERTFGARVARAALFIFLPIVVIVGALVGLHWAKLHLALARAHREFAQRQFMRAEFWASRALSVEQGNPEGMLLMAEINEAQDQPVALAWRIRVAQSEPGDTGAIMAWAKCALRFGQGEMAAAALESLPRDFQDRSAEYHELMAGCALALHQTGLAEAHFATAARLGGDNPVHAINLAAFRLTNSTSPAVRATAAHDLEAALSDARVNLFAARALLVDALHRGDRAGAQAYAAKIRALPQRAFSDDLTGLEAENSKASFQAALAALQHRAETNPLWVAETDDWLNAHGLAGEALRWSAHCPEPVRANTRVQTAVSESYLAQRDWPGLKAFLEKGHWEDGEFLRQAMLIRCQRELGHPWQEKWQQLAVETEANPPDSLLLSQLVIGWNWRDEATGLLWEATARPETEPRALQYLWDIYTRTGETLPLLRVAKRQIELDPANPAKKNNYAFLSLLLFGASENSERLAQEASVANPDVPEWVATYAYALHLAGHETEARQVLERLSPEAKGRPGIALYYAIVLAANGEAARARDCLAALNESGMLPEERKLAAALAQQLKVASR